jgi:hypothetical protein
MKKHFYLVAGKMVFTDANGSETTLGTTELNAMLALENPLITQSVLREAQARLSTLFMGTVQQSGNDPTKIGIVNVILLGINYLGEMLPEYFYDSQPANDSEASVDKPADPALELAQLGRENAPLN